MHLACLEVADAHRALVELVAVRDLHVVHEDHVLAEQDARGSERAPDRAVGDRDGAAAEPVDRVARRSSDDGCEDPDVVARDDDGAGPQQTAAERGEHRSRERAGA